MSYNQDFKGIVQVRGLTVTEDKGEITFDETLLDPIANIDSGDSLSTICSKQHTINYDLTDKYNTLSNDSITEVQKNGTPLTVTANSVNVIVPTNTSDLINDSGFGRPIIMQEYADAEFDGYTTITFPSGRTATDIFKIVGICNDSTYNYYIDGGYFGPFTDSFLYVCNVAKDDGALNFSQLNIKVAVLDASNDISGFAITDGVGTLRIYYK